MPALGRSGDVQHPLKGDLRPLGEDLTHGRVFRDDRDPATASYRLGPLAFTLGGAAANQSAVANIGSAPLVWWDVADTDEARAATVPDPQGLSVLATGPAVAGTAKRGN